MADAGFTRVGAPGLATVLNDLRVSIVEPDP